MRTQTFCTKLHITICVVLIKLLFHAHCGMVDEGASRGGLNVYALATGAGSPWYILVPRAGSLRYISVPGAGSPQYTSVIGLAALIT